MALSLQLLTDKHFFFFLHIIRASLNRLSKIVKQGEVIFFSSEYELPYFIWQLVGEYSDKIINLN